MADASFIRKVADFAEEFTRSWPVFGIGHLGYGNGLQKRAPGSSLASRTDEDGNMQPYSPDDPEVLAKLFGVREDDWERMV